jgi:hypothetical protein
LSCRDSRGDKDELEKARCSPDKCAYHPRSSIPEDWVVEVVGHKLVTHHPVFEPVSAIQARKALPFIGPSMTHGAVRAVERRPATKVVVFQ